MTGKIEATIHIVWDEEGNVAAHGDDNEAADQLDSISNGRFRRVVAVRLTLPPAGPSEIKLVVPDDGEGPKVRQGCNADALPSAMHVPATHNWLLHDRASGIPRGGIADAAGNSADSGLAAKFSDERGGLFDQF